MKVHYEKHCGGEAMVGNIEDKFHKEVLSGNMGFLNCLNDRPAIKQKYVKIMKILSSAGKGFNIKNATKEQLENTARTCEKLAEVFLVLFPDTNISLKMHYFSLVAPLVMRKMFPRSCSKCSESWKILTTFE